MDVYFLLREFIVSGSWDSSVRIWNRLLKSVGIVYANCNARPEDQYFLNSITFFVFLFQNFAAGATGELFSCTLTPMEGAYSHLANYSSNKRHLQENQSLVSFTKMAPSLSPKTKPSLCPNLKYAKKYRVKMF